MAEVAARGLVVEREGVRMLDGVDLSIERGELVAVMGSTGSGKSTLALALARLVPPSAGVVEGVSADRVRVVLQRPEATFLAERVLEEVMLAPIARGEPPAVAERHARALLDQLGLPAELAGRDPLTLSGGEQRRVAVAATLAADPAVLVLDEPAAGLDRAARASLHDVIAALHAAGRTIVLVTHDPDEAARLATRLVVLAGGRTAWDGPAGAVLGDPERAAALGIGVAPEVAVLAAVASARGLSTVGATGTAEDAITRLTALLLQERRVSAPAVVVQRRTGEPAVRFPAHGPESLLRTLPPLVDARWRVLATALAVVAALAAASVLGVALVVAAGAAVVAAARVGATRLRVALRPLLALALLLVALQLLVGGAPDVELQRGVPAAHPAWPAIHRALQATAIVLATLALSASTTVVDLAAALRRLLAPLRLVRLPVATLSFVAATGLGLVPTMADDLDRLRLAQRARGLRSTSRSPFARLRADAMVIGPLFVAAFRRAHLLADALAVRGIDPRDPLPPWRPMRVPAGDVLLLAGGVALVALSRLA